MPTKRSSHFAHLRREMVEHQLIAGGIRDERVLEAMRKVPREAFVPEAYEDAAYADGPLPIGEGQTISQPRTVAFMCEALRLIGNEKVLEIGTGSGYAAAVLSLLVRSVFTVELIPTLARQAQQRLQELGYRNVHVTIGDGTLGLPREAPFDAIVVTAGGYELPAPYAEQIAEGGRILMPIGPTEYSQEMVRFTKHQGQLTVERLGPFAFVPLVGKYGWKEKAE